MSSGLQLNHIEERAHALQEHLLRRYCVCVTFCSLLGDGQHAVCYKAGISRGNRT